MCSPCKETLGRQPVHCGAYAVLDLLPLFSQLLTVVNQKVYWDYVSRKVLTLEYLPGESVTSWTENIHKCSTDGCWM